MTRTVTLAGYVVLAAAAVACEVVARRTGRVATFPRAVSAVARVRPVWWFVLAGWLWIGWHVFVRVHR